jgi:hypothetical protein
MRRGRCRAFRGCGRVKDVHIVIGSLAIALNAVAGVYGAWRWWRVEPETRWFWIALRAGQAVVVVEAALGGILELEHHRAPGLHLLYGLLPIAVALIAEQLRISAAQMVLDARGLESAAVVGELPEDDQRSVVVSILRRELGVMVLAALVTVGLLVRAAGTA